MVIIRGIIIPNLLLIAEKKISFKKNLITNLNE